MPIIYFHANDEDQLAAQAPIGFDDDGGENWWAGVQKCAAAIALTTVAVISSASAVQAQAVANSHQDDPAGSLVTVVPEKDFWINSVAPVPATLIWPQQFSFEQNESAAGLAQPTDEDYWQNPVPPVPATNFISRTYFLDPEEIPAGKLFGQTDEDFWQNSVAPVPASLVWPQQSAFDQQEPAGSLFGQDDEDFWAPPLPWQITLPPSVFRDEDTVVPAVAFNVDEDFWSVPTYITQWQVQVFLDNGGWTPPVVGDEDYWQNWVAPVLAKNLPLYLPDPDEFPATVLFGQPDEDFWQNSAPVANGGKNLPLYLPDAEEIPAAILRGQPDEDYWQNPVPATPFFTWGANKSIYLPDPEEVPVGTLLGQPDEDFWQNPVLPVSASLYQRLPYLPDSEEIPAGSLFSPVFDIDPWLQLIAPVFPNNIIVSPRDAEEIPAGSLFGSMSEDFWQNFVPPVQSTFILPDQNRFEQCENAGLFNFTEEEVWQNPSSPQLYVTPSAAVLAVLYQPEAVEMIVPLPPGAFVQAIAADMFSVTSVFAVRGVPVIATPDQAGTDINLCSSISQLMNIVNNAAYPDSYRLVAATTILLQNDYFKSHFGATTFNSFIDALIATGVKNQADFMGYINRAQAILNTT